MHTLYLSAVDSRCANEDEIRSAGVNPLDLPPKFRLMAHQAHTIAALRYGDAPIIINTAKTGDGKSFAGQFPVFSGERRAMVSYPTNELANDQKRSLDKLKDEWKQGGIQRILSRVINAQELDKMQQNLEHLSRAEMLKVRLTADLILTNPDIFHLIMQMRYRVPGAAVDTVLKMVTEVFNLFVFDEFHIFKAPEATSALTAMLTLLETTTGTANHPRFLFLSATKNEVLEELAKKADLPVTVIQGEYRYDGAHDNADWRRILQPVTLHLYERGEGLESWVEANLALIITFFRENPSARGVILCNSVATAYRVHARLKDACDKAGIDLREPNTGLTPPDARRIDGHLFVATSTVDVGVDFKINLLIFESLDYATHMQRLGRLGRHLSNSAGEPFNGVYQAHALLPSWVIKFISDIYPDDMHIERNSYEHVVESAYIPLQAFREYPERWGGYQAGAVLAEMGEKEVRVEYAQTRQRLQRRFQSLFPVRMLHPNTIREMGENNRIHIWEEAVSFRGSSPFAALVINTLSTGDSVLSYNLMTLLQQGILDPIPFDQVYRLAGDRAEALKKTDPLIAYRLNGWLPHKPRRLIFRLNEPTSTWGAERFGTVIEQDRFRIEFASGNDIPRDMTQLNAEIETRTLVTLLIRAGDVKKLYSADPDSIRTYFRLGMSIELFRFRSQDGISEGTVAFGRDALLLDSLIFRRKSSTDDPFFG